MDAADQAIDYGLCPRSMRPGRRRRIASVRFSGMFGGYLSSPFYGSPRPTAGNPRRRFHVRSWDRRRRRVCARVRRHCRESSIVPQAREHHDVARRCVGHAGVRVAET